MKTTIEQALLLLAEALYRESADRHDVVVTLASSHVAALRRELAETDTRLLGDVLHRPGDVVLNGPVRVVVREVGGHG